MFDTRINEIWHTIKVSIQDGGAMHGYVELENQWKDKKVQAIYLHGSSLILVVSFVCSDKHKETE